MKKLFTLFLSLILCLSSLSLFACQTNEPQVEVEEPKQEQTVAPTPTPTPKLNQLKVQSLNVRLGGTTVFNAPSGGGTEESYIEKSIEAVVKPDTALNKAIDYSVAWDNSATRKAEDVEDYIKVLQDSDGSLTAKVRCYKNFGEDQIIITATSRDGNKTGTCVCSYVGMTTGLTIACGGLTLSHTEARGDFHDLKIGNTYNFNLSLFDALGSVNGDYEIKVSYVKNGYDGHGGLVQCSYFYIEPETGCILAMANNGNGRDSLDTKEAFQFVSSGFSSTEDPNDFLLTGRYPRTTPIFDYSFENNVLSITPKTIIGYTVVPESGFAYDNYVMHKKLATTNNASTTEYEDIQLVRCFVTNELVFATNSQWNYLAYQSSISSSGYTYSNLNKDFSILNIYDVSSDYALITVTDKNTGVSDSIKFWISMPVSEVNLPTYMNF